MLKVAKHPVLERHDDDLYVQKEISFTQAALGATLTVPGLDGELELEIPKSTQTGAVFRLMGKGVPHLNGRGRGDEYIVVKVVTPTNLSTEEKRLLLRFEKLRKQVLKKEEHHG